MHWHDPDEGEGRTCQQLEGTKKTTRKTLLLHTVHFVRWTLRQGKAKRANPKPQIFSVDSVWQQSTFIHSRGCVLSMHIHSCLCFGFTHCALYLVIRFTGQRFTHFPYVTLQKACMCIWWHDVQDPILQHIHGWWWYFFAMNMHIESILYVHPLLTVGHIVKPMCIPSTQNK